MAKICIVTDSSVALYPEEALKLGIEIAPLSVIIKGKEYKDLLDISPKEIIDTLRAGDDITTSQPNLGFLDAMMERLKGENYDDIIVFSIAGYLSGTYQAFRLAATTHDLKNIHIIDTLSAAGPIRHVAIEARKMADAGASVEEILAYADKVFKDTITYILPDNLNQLRKGGRVKGSVAALSNLLKIKLCLYISADVTTIEKFDTNRTEVKLFNSIYEDMKKRGFSAKTHKVYLPQCDALGRLNSFKAFLDEKEPGVDAEVIILPAGIAAHVGLNTYGIQTALKA
jgi:DegV family protein with EDD domain